MKKVFVFVVTLLSLSTLLSACAKKQDSTANTEEAKTRTKKTNSSISDSSESEVAEDMNIPEKIYTSDSKEWEKPDIQSYLGSYEGEYIINDNASGAKDIMNVEITINTDGSYNMATYQSQIYDDINSSFYFDSANNLNSQNKFISNLHYETGILDENYGQIVCLNLIQDNPCPYFDQNGLLETQLDVNDPQTHYQTPDMSKVQSTSIDKNFIFNNGEIKYEYNGNEFNLKSNDNNKLTNESLYRKWKTWSKMSQDVYKVKNDGPAFSYDSESIYSKLSFNFKNKNDFLQFVQPYHISSSSDDVHVEEVNPIEFDAHTKDNKKINAEWGLKFTKDHSSDVTVYLYDGKTIYTANLNDNPIEWK